MSKTVQQVIRQFARALYGKPSFYGESAEISLNLLVDLAKEVMFEQYQRMFSEPHIDKDAYFEVFVKNELFLMYMFGDRYTARGMCSEDTFRTLPELEAWWEKFSSREKFEQVASNWDRIVTSLVHEVLDVSRHHSPSISELYERVRGEMEK